MHPKTACFFLVIGLYLNSVSCEEKGCVRLEKLFNDICKEGGDRKTRIMNRAAQCYVGMLPPDADKDLRDYFEKRCSNKMDFCDQKVRDRCGPKAFEQMDEKQKESAMNFFEKHQKDFPQYCDNGFKCLMS